MLINGHFSDFIYELIEQEKEKKDEGWHERTEYLYQQLEVVEAIETARTDGDTEIDSRRTDDVKNKKWRDFLTERFPKHAEWLQNLDQDQKEEGIEHA